MRRGLAALFTLFALLLFVPFLVQATTYYAPTSGVSSWTSAVWATSSDQSSGSSGPPGTGDTVILDGYAGAVTCSGNCQVGSLCTNTSCGAASNYTGTLTISSAGYITINASAGLVLDSAMTPSGTGEITLYASSTINTAGLSLPWSIYFRGNAQTYTLAGAVTTTGTVDLDHSGGGNSTISGAYNITAGTLQIGCPGYTVTIPAGVTYTANSALVLYGGSAASGTPTILKSSSTSTFALVYNGTIANENVSNMTFQYVAASGTAIYDFNGGTNTGSTGITNETASNFTGGSSTWGN
jgi:hypothetical protein